MYPMIYVSDEGKLCCEYCRHNHPEYVTGEIYWEGSPLECDECGEMIDSAYGEPADGITNR